jgi:hypothetical protein
MGRFLRFFQIFGFSPPNIKKWPGKPKKGLFLAEGSVFPKGMIT